MADVNIEIDVDSSDAERSLKKYNRALDKTEKNTKELDNSTKGFELSLSKTAIAGAAAAASVVAIGRGLEFAIDSAIEIENLTTQFIAFTGSAEGAAEQIERLADFSAGTPFQLEELATANRTLLAFGSSTEESLEQLRQLGEVASATGTNVGELATIFGQIQAAGRLTGERFLQLAERGVNIGPQLAESLGVAESSLEDLRRQGKISADDVAEAFRTLTSEGGQFFGATERQAKTLSGSLSTLQDNVTLLGADVGNLLKPAASGLTIEFTKLVQSTREYIKELTELTPEQRQSQNAIAKTKEEIEATEQRLRDLRSGTTTASTLFLKFGQAIGGITDPIALTEQNLAKLQARLAGLEEQSTLRQAQEDFDKTTKSLNELRKAQGEFEAEQEQKKQNEGRADDLAAEEERVKRIADLEKNLTTIVAQETATRQALETANDDFLVQSLTAREEQLTAKRAELEASKLEAQGQFNEAAILLAETNAQRLEEIEADKEDAITAKRKEEEENRIEQAAKARKEEFDLDIQTEKAKADFEKQTFAQRVQTTRAGLNALISLQNTGSKEAFEIAKAANIAQALISIPTTAIEAYKSLAGIPGVGPALGAAAAAAATVAGVSNLNRIRATSFQQGGEVPPGFPNDSFPALLSSGEVVVPEKNFDQIQRERTPTETQDAQVSILTEILTAQQELSESIRERPIEVSLMIDGEILANQILDLNQDNARLA